MGNAAFELADLRAEQEREAGVIQVQAAVSARGGFMCVDCPLPIDDERRRAAPFAARCIDCQRLYEKASRRRA